MKDYQVRIIATVTIVCDDIISAENEAELTAEVAKIAVNNPLKYESLNYRLKFDWDETLQHSYKIQSEGKEY